MAHFSGIKEKDYHYICNNIDDIEDFAWWLHIHHPELLRKIAHAIKQKQED